MEKEVWKVLPSNTNYLVSSLGRVQVLPRKAKNGKKFKGKILNESFNAVGYLKVSVERKTRAVHQLVVEAFLGHTSCGHKIVVDHINNIKTDNRLVNLQLITQRQNKSKDLKKGTSKYVGVSWKKDSRRWRSTIMINRKQKHLGMFDSEKEAAKAYQKELINLN